MYYLCIEKVAKVIITRITSWPQTRQLDKYYSPNNCYYRILCKGVGGWACVATELQQANHKDPNNELS